MMEQVANLNASPDAKALLLTLVQQNAALQLEIDQLKQEREDELLPTVEAMEILGCGRKKFWQLSQLEGFPKPIPFGRSNHYKRVELVAYRERMTSEAQHG